MDADLQCVKVSPFSTMVPTHRMVIVGTKNHIYFIIFMMSLTAGVLMFDYLVWIRKHCQRRFIALIHLISWILCLDVLALKDAPFPARSCVLPFATCRRMSADAFLCSIAIWSTLQLLWSAIIVVHYVSAAWNVWRHKFRDLFITGAALAA